MAHSVVTRTQRRNERKQLALVFVLILAVAGASFTLGFIYGQKTAISPEDGQSSAEQRFPGVAQLPAPADPELEKGPQKPEDLTFYDNLPKGKQAPLGSGINLPPKKKGAKPARIDTDNKPTKSTSKSEIIKQTSPRPTEGAFVVQIASFRSEADAAKLIKRLDPYSLKAFVETVDLGEKGTWYRVLSGPFDTRENAAKTVSLLQEKERLSALIRQR